MAEKLLNPPPGFPVPAFNAPGHIEAVHVERVDITATGYTKLSRGTLYNTVVGADQNVVDQYPGLFLLREIIEPRAFPWSFRYWGLGEAFTTRSLGQPNLTPAKYRRLVRTVETNQPVSKDYTFPSGLTGDQTEIELAQETIEEARLKIISEIIAIGADPLTGGETSEWGSLSIYETVVNEGTPIDSGFLVLKSTVTPFGNGKAVKITVKYPLDLALRQLLTKSLGQENLVPAKYRRLVRHTETDSLVDPDTFTFPAGLTGDQSEVRYVEEAITRARLKIVEEIIAVGADPLLGGETNEFGPLSISETIVNDGTPIDAGYLVLKSTVSPLGNGKSVKITVNYPLNLALQSILRRTIGQDNLTPAKYRRLVKHTETETMVDLATYVFPSVLTGDQTQIQAIQETISRARQTIISEVIDVGANPLVGGEADEYGVLSITETIVNDGTPIDTGFLIRHSTVTPFGNGKSLKITVVYVNAQIAGVRVTNGGAGGSNGTYTNGTFTGGGGSGATFGYTVSGGVVQPAITILTPGTGYTLPPTAVFPAAGAGIAATSYLGTPILSSRPYDEEMQVRYDESRQIVMAGTPDSPPIDTVSEESKALDVWRLLRVITKKTPTAVDVDSALISYTSRPFTFPGLLPSTPNVVIGSNIALIPFGYRKSRADLTKVKVKTWWVTSASAPVILKDEIITDTVFVFTMEDSSATLIAKRFEGVLHNSLSATYVAGSVSFLFAYQPTTPSYSQYTARALYTAGGTTTFTNGSPTITGSGTDFSSQISIGNFIEGIAVTAVTTTSITLASNWVLATFVTSGQFNFQNGVGWIGGEKTIAADVIPTKQTNLWKIRIELVVMK